MPTQNANPLTAEAVQEVAEQFAAIVRFNASQPDTAACEECGVDLGIAPDPSDYLVCNDCAGKDWPSNRTERSADDANAWFERKMLAGGTFPSGDARND